MTEFEERALEQLVEIKECLKPIAFGLGLAAGAALFIMVMLALG